MMMIIIISDLMFNSTILTSNSQVRMTAILTLMVTRFYKLWRYGDTLWRNVHIKFHKTEIGSAVGCFYLKKGKDEWTQQGVRQSSVCTLHDMTWGSW